MKPRNPDSYRRVISQAQKDRLRELRTIHGHAASSRGTHSRTYQSWMSMKERCDSPDHKSYAAYGGRGIAYCDSWKDFVNFLADMGERPEGKTLGRIDNEGRYEPKNCRWETYKEQARNTRSNRFLTFKGQTACVKEWSERTGINLSALEKRLAAEWPLELALTVPVKYGQKVVCK